MNRSTIIFAFYIAGFISVTMHDLVFGPVAYGPNNAVHQVAKKYNKTVVANSPKVSDLAFKQ